MRGDHDSVDPVEHCADSAHVLLQRAQNRRRVPQDVDALRGGDREERLDGGRENECEFNLSQHRTNRDLGDTWGHNIVPEDQTFTEN